MLLFCSLSGVVACCLEGRLRDMADVPKAPSRHWQPDHLPNNQQRRGRLAAPGAHRDELLVRRGRDGGMQRAAGAEHLATRGIDHEMIDLEAGLFRHHLIRV